MNSPHSDPTPSEDATASLGNASAVPSDGVTAPENALRHDYRSPYNNPPPSYYGPNPMHPFPPHGSYIPQPIHSHVVPQESAARASLWIATGGFLGMTAAAAIRWLNGEDFSFFPPAPRQETPSQEDALQQQMEVVVQEIRIQNKQQEKILQRLSSTVEKQRTNECVDLLRAKPNMEETLTNIQSELSCLRESLSTKGSDWDTRLSETLDNLQKCMEQISHSKNSLPSSSHSSKIIGHSTPAIPCVSLKDDNDDEQLTENTNSLEESIRILVERNSPDDLRAGAQLLYLYVSNLSNHPTAPRYRKIFTSNDSFQKVDRLVGGKEFLMALGFVESGNYLEWKVAEDSMDRQIELLNGAASALKVVKTVSSHVDPDFVERAVAAAVLPTLGTIASCPPTPMQAGIMSPLFAETPEIGLIASPPNTRKQIYDKPEFPLLHANGMHRVDSPVLSMSPESNHLDRTTESLSPIRGDEKDTEATGVLWK